MNKAGKIAIGILITAAFVTGGYFAYRHFTNPDRKVNRDTKLKRNTILKFEEKV